MLCVIAVTGGDSFHTRREKDEAAGRISAAGGLQGQFMRAIFGVALRSVLVFYIATMVITCNGEKKQSAYVIYVLSSAAVAFRSDGWNSFAAAKNGSKRMLTRPVCKTSAYAGNFSRLCTFRKRPAIYPKNAAK
jgi:hypothetical protein